MKITLDAIEVVDATSKTGKRYKVKDVKIDDTSIDIILETPFDEEINMKHISVAEAVAEYFGDLASIL